MAAPGLEHDDRLEVLFERASRLSRGRRAALLDQIRGEDPEIASELESLLRASESAGGFFESLGKTLFSGDPAHPEIVPEIDPLYGSHVGEYRIDTVLGRGGMGTVYRAVKRDIDEVCALKFLPALAAASPEVRARFVAEARVTARVEHPNVCEISDISETDDGRLYLVMPYYGDVTLKARLREGALPVEEALDWFRQTCAGLAAVHAAGIIHRDLTPGNLIRDEGGVVKILDFGLAKVVNVTLGTGNRTLGTVAYMAPEQLIGPDLDHRADLWSLGVILFEMLWGRRPFASERMADQMGEITGVADLAFPDLPAGADPRIGEIVRGLMALDPEDRPSLAEVAGI